MFKRSLLFTGLFLFSITLFGQTKATDFALNDCDGNFHHLFGKINEGKVVMLVWVMPCSSCIYPTKKAYDVFVSLESTYPGRILFYLIDDFANTSCAALESWGIANIGDKISAHFSNSAINMYNYGTPGMPKIVVVGSPNYKIYYNVNATSSSDLPDLKNVLLNAISLASTNNEPDNKQPMIQLYPNPVHNELYLFGNIPQPQNLQFELYHISGQKIKTWTEKIDQAGDVLFPVSLESLVEGVYFIKVNGQILRFIHF